MARLFVAIDLPPDVTTALQRIQPPARRGVRLASFDQMHLTLHFIGETEIEFCAAALAAVRSPRFELTLAGTGRFPAAGGGSTLWAGVRENSKLHELHQAIARSLIPCGFTPESRSYSPHVTLARCGPETSGHIINEFLEAGRNLFIPDIPVQGFVLFSSDLAPGRSPVYHRERTFPLTDD